MRHRALPTVEASSMADIAFLLLIFFLVATTIEEPQGIQVLLPKIDESAPILPVNQDRVLTIAINADDVVMVEGDLVPVSSVKTLVMSHVLERIALKDQPIVSLTTNRDNTYAQYITVYDQIKSAYGHLRDREADRSYGKTYHVLTAAQRKQVNKVIPMIISESEWKAM